MRPFSWNGKLFFERLVDFECEVIIFENQRELHATRYAQSFVSFFFSISLLFSHLLHNFPFISSSCSSIHRCDLLVASSVRACTRQHKKARQRAIHKKEKRGEEDKKQHTARICLCQFQLRKNTPPPRSTWLQKVKESEFSKKKIQSCCGSTFRDCTTMLAFRLLHARWALLFFACAGGDPTNSQISYGLSLRCSSVGICRVVVVTSHDVRARWREEAEKKRCQKKNCYTADDCRACTPRWWLKIRAIFIQCSEDVSGRDAAVEGKVRKIERDFLFSWKSHTNWLFHTAELSPK